MNLKRNRNFKDLSRWPNFISILELSIILFGIVIALIVYFQTIKIGEDAKNARIFEQQTRTLIISASTANVNFSQLLEGNSEIEIDRDVYALFVIADSLCGKIDRGVIGSQLQPFTDGQSGGTKPGTVCAQLGSFRELLQQRWQDHLDSKPDSMRMAYENSYIQLLETLQRLNSVTDPRLQETESQLRTALWGFGIGLALVFISIAFIVRHTRLSLTGKTRQLEAEIELRTKLNQDLDREKNFINTLINNIPDAVFAKNRENKYLVANPATADVMNVEHKEELIGKSEEDFQPPDVAKRIVDEDEHILETGELFLNHQGFLMDLITGKPRWRLTTKVPLRDASGQIIGLVGISRDITKQKETEEALVTVNEKLTQGISSLEKSSLETAQLSEMIDLLQACPNTEEACVVIADQLSKFFPLDSGLLYLFNTSRNILDRSVSWGRPCEESLVLKPEDCWGLRRGKMHIVQGGGYFTIIFGMQSFIDMSPCCCFWTG
jgi:PAS domain S-box-containing protein